MRRAESSATPLRRIVFAQPHDWLRDGFKKMDFAVSAKKIESLISVRGMSFDMKIPPLKIPDFGASGVGLLRGARKNLTGPAGTGFALAAEFEDQEALDRFASDKAVEIRGIFSDPPIAPFPVINPTGPVGTAADVVANLNLAPFKAAKLEGQGVKVIVVDTGIDQSRVPVSGGFSINPAVAPGNSPAGHGTMVAFDAVLAAPRAAVYDYPLLKSRGTGQWVAFLSDAMRVFTEIWIQVYQTPGPAVVVNSWGMYDRSFDAPLASPQNYSANPRHPFNQMIMSMTGSGLDVVFAAGNCGSTCPDDRCGKGDTGPGCSIHGANSHPEVVSVAAVTVNDDVLGYSSEGPGGLAANKPDIAGFSHFAGSGIEPADSGTSAACPVVAGVIAALRTKSSPVKVPPTQLKSILLKSARAVGKPGWDPRTGAGVVDAGAALALLGG
jgi:hypothetical protein